METGKTGNQIHSDGCKIKILQGSRITQYQHLDLKIELEKISKIHRQCLPWTASSRAGFSTVNKLYQILLKHDSFLLFYTETAFLSITTDRRACEKFLISKLDFKIKIKLFFFNLLQPKHLLANIFFNLKKRQDIKSAYILTLGRRSQHESCAQVSAAKDLLKVCENFLLERGVREIWVDTEDSNKKAMQFYQRHFFSINAQIFGNCFLLKKLTS